MKTHVLIGRSHTIKAHMNRGNVLLQDTSNLNFLELDNIQLTKLFLLLKRRDKQRLRKRKVVLYNEDAAKIVISAACIFFIAICFLNYLGWI